ncbi:MAG: hypothetical protein BKP49_05440 [Treponema sp. CETP13]|nr:MAG: hypothetical protein BKP49_05440 [Treponema sp. CETP13]
MKSTLKLGFTLAAFAAISCTVLAIVNNFTAPVIAEHAAEKSNAGLSIVFPDATKFTTVDDVTKGNTDVESLNKYLKENLNNIDGLYIAYNGDSVVGAVAQVDGPSYDHVTLMVGIDMKRTITGMKILETSDSPGYGQEALKPEFYEQFTGIDASESLVAGESFDAISGATISSNAYADLINFAVYIAGDYLANNFGGASGSAAPTGPVTYEKPFSFGQALFEIFDIQNNENLKVEWITNDLPETVNSFTTGHAFSVVDMNTNKIIGAIVAMTGMSNNHDATVIVGVNLKRTILGARIMKLDDAPGFGLAARNKSFYSQFKGKSVDTYFGPGAGITAIENAMKTSESISHLVQAAGWAASEWLAENAEGKKASPNADPFTITITEGSTYTVPEAIFDIYDVENHPELTTKDIETLPTVEDDNLTITKGIQVFDNDTLKAIAFEINGKLYSHDGSVLVSINTNGIIDGIRITKINDTPMLGNKALGKSFWNQFTGKPANGELSVPETIDAISGATVTSTRITALVNFAAKAYNKYVAN